MLKLRQYTVYSKILQLCIDSRSLKSGELIHSRLIIIGFPQKTKLISFYSSIGEIRNARKVFDQMSERSLDDWSILISGYCKCDDEKEALMIFYSMRVAGICGNQFTYGSALSACIRLLFLKLGKQLHCCVEKSRFANNLFVQSALVDFHAKCGKMEDARSVFELMETRDLVSWNVLIGGYAAQGYTRSAIIAFCQMLGKGILPDSFSFGNLLKSSNGNESLAKVSVIHGYVSKFGFGSHKFSIGCLIDAYVKCGCLDTAHILYRSLKKVDVVSCTTLIKGYASEGTNLEEALILFLDVNERTTVDEILLCTMLNICAKTTSVWLGKQLHSKLIKRCHLQHDIAMNNSLIDMYCKSGVIEDARLVFDEMGPKNVISFTSLIAGCGINGHGHEAVELFSEMEKKGVKPNDVTLLSLLSACDHDGLPAQAWEFINTLMIKYEIKPEPKHFSCMANGLARKGYMVEAYDLVDKLHGSGAEKVFGLRAILGACSTYRNTVFGRIVARSLFWLESENQTNYVVLSGIFVGAGLWEIAMGLKEFRGKVKHSSCSVCSSS